VVDPIGGLAKLNLINLDNCCVVRQKCSLELQRKLGVIQN